MNNTTTDHDTFSNDAYGLDPSHPTQVVELDDGAHMDLRIAPVAHHVGDDQLRMLAYNGSIPGPVLRVRQGSEITVRARNDGDVEATVHWHGLCLDNKYDGVPYETQAPIPLGDEFTYRLSFPNEGLYWYHPHIREDYGLDMGLYGTILVDPQDPDCWAAVNREFIVTVDDVLVEDGRIAPFHRGGPNYVAMGRFGNVMLTGGQAGLGLEAQAGDVVRFYFVNTANTRVFNLTLPGLRMKLVGGDSGRYEHERFVDEVLLAPSERAIIDVHFDRAGIFPLEHHTPDHTYVLGNVVVSGGDPGESYVRQFEDLRTSAELTSERSAIATDIQRPPDKTLAFDSLMPLLYGGTEAQTATAWTCPMHPEIVRSEPGVCPICGMKLVPMSDDAEVPAAETTPHEHQHDNGDGIEWEDLMPVINKASDATNMTWKLVDTDTRKENGAIDWTFRVGDRVKIRLENGMEQDHPMHHPFHIHGAGRFVVLSRDDVPEDNLVWKDTVLIPAGQTVDILLDVTNVGLWMAHCHIAEHHESGMMFSFEVTP